MKTMTSYQLPVISYQLSVTSHRLSVVGCRFLRVLILCLLLTGYRSPVTGQNKNIERIMAEGEKMYEVPYPWTFERCLWYAQNHNIDIKQRNLQIESAKIELSTSKMSRLPNLNAGVGQNWNFGRTQTSLGIYEDITQSTTNFSVGSSMPLFTGNRIPNEIARNKLDMEAATENLKKAREDLTLNLAGLYLQILFCKETLQVSEEQHRLSQNQTEKTRLLVDAGRIARAQLSDIQAQVAKDKVALVEAQNNLKLALLDLAQLLELEPAPDFDIVAPNPNHLIMDDSKQLLPPPLLYNYAVNVKPAIKEQELRVQSAKKAIGIAQSGYSPTLSLEMGISTGYYYIYGGRTVYDETTDQTYSVPNNSFESQFKNNLGEYIGLSLQIPIFNRFSTRNQVKNARINADNQQLVLENAKKTLYKEIQTAYQNALAADEKYKASELAASAAEESFNATVERYEIGKATAFDFNEAKTKWIQAQQDRLQAKYNYVFRTKILDVYGDRPILL
ncbi:MAG: TolC family protein [Candidatus Symbiothrix sp.]|jgi:outer membrane protein|nr:TolC family protein [Candidatus Symbiothrix sp.]